MIFWIKAATYAMLILFGFVAGKANAEMIWRRRLTNFIQNLMAEITSGKYVANTDSEVSLYKLIGAKEAVELILRKLHE